MPGGPFGVAKLTIARVLPNAYNQYANEFNRGNDTSGAPTCSGTTKLANANTIGVAKNSSIIVPCIVNSSLYCSVDRNCNSGRASSARINNARNPPTVNQTSEVTRYITPISLASVVRNTRPTNEPFTAGRTGAGRATIGFGATVVMPAPMCPESSKRGAPYPSRHPSKQHRRRSILSIALDTAFPARS
jgi:hypothetical protein